ncbi:MAG TPA: NAD(P)H-dependent oxidoreductase subunit E [Candidatus Dormibacteraeota bacterium]|nr:NAD(P)H-dependent oxidoreductase subunit E [Candidatus Dormibacteraeota bacterium]
MDIKLAAPPATAEERAAVDELLGPPSGWQGGVESPVDQRVAFGGHAARARRHLLLPTLHAVQDGVGFISPGALDYVCARLTIPPAEAYGVATGYALLSLEPQPPLVVHVCDDIACKAAGADELCHKIERRAGSDGSAHPDRTATWHRSPCLGLCDRAPGAFVQRAGNRATHGEASIAAADAELITGLMAGKPWPHPAPQAIPQVGDPGLRLLRRVGVVDPQSLDSYRAAGGYAALRRAFELGAEGVIREIADSKLLGRGGAAFPTGRKWEAVARAPERPHYLVCNADESEPGTFKDRILMEQDPFAIVEAMTIGGYATGCERGYLYVRGEYPLARQRIQHAIDQAEDRGLLGSDIMGRGVDFTIEVRRGGGAYICGEETALFNSIEGKRGEPRNKPPFPVQSGLFGKPTVVNNVETLLNIPDIVTAGGRAFAAIGTPESTGTRLFCLSGAVGRPGLYEAPFGLTLRQVLDLAGGVHGRLQAILLGGAAGSFVTSDQFDLPLTFEATRAAGVTLGSGVVMAFDDSVDMNAIVLRIARFFRDESCGQCVPCRVGTVRQEEALYRLAGSGSPDDVAMLSDIGRAMRDASICGLGQTASAAAESALRLGLFSGNRSRGR